MDIVAALTAKGIRPIILDEERSKFWRRGNPPGSSAFARHFQRSIASS